MRILAFGIAKEIVGGREISLDLPGVASVEALRAQLNERYPRLQQLSSYVIAVNDEYADGHVALAEKDEIAIIPPVSGG